MICSSFKAETSSHFLISLILTVFVSPFNQTMSHYSQFSPCRSVNLFLVFLTCCMCHLLAAIGQTLFCDPYECNGVAINISQSWLRCDGYQSCNNSTFTFTEPDFFFWCSGVHSCMYSSFDAEAGAICWGYLSCAYSSVRNAVGGRGEMSGYRSNIRVKAESGSWFAVGMGSWSDSNIVLDSVSLDNLFIRSFLSLTNSVVDIVETGAEIEILIPLVNTTFICNNGGTCSIDYNGVCSDLDNNVKLIEQNGAFDVSCNNRSDAHAPTFPYVNNITHFFHTRDVRYVF